MAKEDENPATPIASKPSPNLKKDQSPATVNSQSSSSHPMNNTCANKNANDDSTPPKNPLTPKEFIVSVAAKIASQPLHYSDPGVWGVLTAISETARKRQQGINMLLTSDEHCIGRVVKDVTFQIVSPAVSANHCKIYRKIVAAGDGNNSSSFFTSVFLKDSSTNGTYLNWEKLNKGSSEATLRHGDIISFAFPPDHVSAIAFVFREILKLSNQGDGASLKRKAEEPGSESKRLKGIGIGALEGPISLDDFRSLQRSNTELRKMLEDQVAKIESLRTENRASIERREIEMKDLKESISESYLGQLKELQQLLEAKENELIESNRISSEQKHAVEDLNERLGASVQSCAEANEVISSQKASISELKASLDEERDQRREEREKAVEDLKISIQRIQAEAQEEMKRLSDAAAKREKEQQEVINKLQESEKERCSLMETLRSKLEDTREKLVMSENKVRQLEAQVREEQLAAATRRKRVEELELDTKRLRKELESEKQAAREEAWAKVSALELEINAAMRDLDFERRRLKGARERIMLRETQLRAFYSTTEEIQVLFVKQQEQLKAMQRTLEDEENYENTSIDVDLNLPNGHIQRFLSRDKEVYQSAAKGESSTSTQRYGRDHNETSSDEVSVTEKHDCNMKIHGNDDDTQEVEFSGAQHSVKGGFGSEIDGVGAARILEGDPVGTEKNLETDGIGTLAVSVGDLVATERILETESPGQNRGGSFDLNKCGALGEDTMQLEDETNGEAIWQAEMVPSGSLHHSQCNNPLEVENTILDTQTGDSIKTADLLASEVPGSWAYSTAPSVHGENDTPKSKDNDDAAAATLHDSVCVIAESQNVPSSKSLGARWNKEHEALSKMIGIVAPDLKEQFRCAAGSNYIKEGAERGDVSDSNTDGCYDDDNHDANSEGESDAETIGGGGEKEDLESDHGMEEDDEATQDDSYG
ncbi:uncharacterized protein [Coffea arabica]|uniref:Uncharacterized protein isoform X1 n=1 Tax=Coffea arabica TaxID=13443 RepID=A0ABM4WL69_COFAR